MQNRIKELREAAGITQTELGNRMGGISGVNIGRYEKQPHRITLPLLQQIADALGVLPVDIISDTRVTHASAAIIVKIRGKARTVMFDRSLIADISAGSPVEAVMIADDTMEPTLAKGMLAIVDVGHPKIDRDGLYLIQIGTFEAVRRINVQINGTLRISVDNTRRASDMLAQPEEMTAIGRILWAGGVV